MWATTNNFRYMHIESHLQYRPYKCSVCGYDNRKEIFISLHIKKTHGGAATVEYKPDPELEHRFVLPSLVLFHFDCNAVLQLFKSSISNEITSAILCRKG